jgi:hypothetical protein
MIVISQNNNVTVTSSFDILGHGVGLYIERGLSLVALIKATLSCFKKREECVVFTRPSKLHVPRKDSLNARGWNFEEEHPKL